MIPQGHHLPARWYTWKQRLTPAIWSQEPCYAFRKYFLDFGSSLRNVNLIQQFTVVDDELCHFETALTDGLLRLLENATYLISRRYRFATCRPRTSLDWFVHLSLDLVSLAQFLGGQMCLNSRKICRWISVTSSDILQHSSSPARENIGCCNHVTAHELAGTLHASTSAITT